MLEFPSIHVILQDIARWADIFMDGGSVVIRPKQHVIYKKSQNLVFANGQFYSIEGLDGVICHLRVAQPFLNHIKPR